MIDLLLDAHVTICRMEGSDRLGSGCKVPVAAYVPLRA